MRLSGIFKKRETTYLYLFMGLILLIATVLRIYDLGRFGFWWDELYHVIAAKSILHEGRPFIPLNGEYKRALPFTYIVAMSFKLFGINEISGRMPSIIFNFLFIIIGFFIVRNLMGKGVAFLFVIVMSFSPFVLEVTRQCRMYSLFQLLYFLMAYFFFIGFEHNGPGSGIFKKIESRYQINMLYLICFFFLFFGSLIIHSLTYNFTFVIFFYSLGLLFYQMKTDGTKKSISSKYFLCLIAMIGALIYLIVFKNDFLISMWHTATTIPIWDVKKKSNYFFYRYFLSDNYPAFFFIYPLSCILMVKDYGKKGFFIFVSFVPLIILHMWLFGRQLDRYIFYIFPYFVLGSLYLINQIIGFVYNEVNAKIIDLPKVIKVAIILVAVMTFNVFGYPWIASSRNVHKRWRYHQWQGIPTLIKNEVNKGKVITTRQMAYIYYFGRIPDFFMRAIPDFEYVHDPKYNIKVIENLEGLKTVFRTTDRPLYVVSTPWTFNADVITMPEMRKFILNNCEPILTEKEIIIFKKID